MTDIQPSKFTELGQRFIRQYLALGPGSRFKGGPTYRELTEFGAKLRDEWLHQYAILPGAVGAFVEVATSREWHVTGAPRHAARAVEKINNSFFVDDYGIEHVGFESTLSRMALDWLTVGRLAFTVKRRGDTTGPMEYLDSTRLNPENYGTSTLWRYSRTSDDRVFRQSSVFFNDCVRLGATGLFLGKVAYLIPVAKLDWYIREHDTAKLDGRNIRDIIFVADDAMVDALEQAMQTSFAIATGNTTDNTGVPVVGVNIQGANNMKMADMFARLGLSEIPEQFKREEFEFRYANEIAGTIGLSLRYFWNDPRGTNRSLEQVAQERQSVQGPSFFVRSVQRTINNANFLGARDKVRFSFEEEVDSAAQARKALTLKDYSIALTGLVDLVSPRKTPMSSKDAMGNVTTEMVEVERSNSDLIQGDAILSFLQREGLLTTDITLPDLITLEESDVFSRNADPLDKGEVMLDSSGRVVERRSEFSIALSGAKNG